MIVSIGRLSHFVRGTDNLQKKESNGQEQSQIHEIGSVCSVQGFDGLMQGYHWPSVKYRDGKIIFDISESK